MSFKELCRRGVPIETSLGVTGLADRSNNEWSSVTSTKP